MSRKVKFDNPTKNTDGTAFDAKNNTAGYDVVIDGQPAVSVPVGYATEIDLESLAGFSALKAGKHTVQLDVVSKEGARSDLSAPATFPVVGTPLAPTITSVD
jgi:hypothetical protein